MIYKIFLKKDDINIFVDENIQWYILALNLIVLAN